jgi:ABC-type hemin transport system ATPase subunit
MNEARMPPASAPPRIVLSFRARLVRISIKLRGASMIRSLQLTNYRGFDSFRVSCDKTSLLIGPNNAGKSTILTVLRLTDTLVRSARARNPTDWHEVSLSSHLLVP